MRKLYFIGLSMLLFLSGCVHTQTTTAIDLAQINSRARRVVVLPLDNLTTTPNAGRIVGDLLTTEIIASTHFLLLERSEMMEKLVAGTTSDASEVLEKAAALKIGRDLGVDTVIFGSVTEFRYKRGLDEDPIVGLTIRMLDVPENKILWAESVSATGSANSSQSSLSALSHLVCAELVKHLSVQATVTAPSTTKTDGMAR